MKFAFNPGRALTALGRLGAGVVAGLALYTVAAAPAAHAQPAATAVPPGETGPALWVVRDADSTLYLFGTVHMMRPETQWRTPRIEEALRASDTLYLEIKEVDPASAASVQPLMLKYGMAETGRGLSTLMTAQDMTRLDAIARTLGATGAAFEPLRPWMAALQVTVAGIVRAGYSPTSGVDPLLKAAAVEAGKPVMGLETVEQQLSFFAGLSDEIQADFLRQTLADFDEGPARLDAIVDAWARGDDAVLAREIVDEMKTWGPVYDALLVRRNADWARQIKTMLDGSGTAFIAVGAGHLVGEDSVQAALARQGVLAERL